MWRRAHVFNCVVHMRNNFPICYYANAFTMLFGVLWPLLNRKTETACGHDREKTTTKTLNILTDINYSIVVLEINTLIIRLMFCSVCVCAHTFFLMRPNLYGVKMKFKLKMDFHFKFLFCQYTKVLCVFVNGSFNFRSCRLSKRLIKTIHGRFVVH